MPTKLELKLLEAKKKKEEREAIERAEREEKETIERELKANATVAVDLPRPPPSAVEKNTATVEEVSENIDGIKLEEEADVEETAEEIEARMKATMYGDDVHSEWGHAVEEAENEDATGGSGKKLSNKAKRKLQKEAEAKAREDEYNAAAMKASFEGAQFACSQTAIDQNDPQWQNALDIIIPSISISAHKKELFVNAEFTVAHGRRYGLVGPNGAGKSTLLKMIASGELKVPPRVDYLYVEQEVMADETPAVDAVLKSDKVRWALVQEEKQLLKDLEKTPDEAKDVRLGEVYEQLNQIGASSAESRARRILFGLGFDAEMQVRPTKYFSGGWRMRISLARALFMEPTLLMLDEPTNHLDLNAVIWLDDYLTKWKKTLLIVSHDQDFLNSVCQEVVHLDEKKLFYYKGNYDNFKEQDAQKKKNQQKLWEKQEKKIRELKMKGVAKGKAEEQVIKSKSREPGARAAKKAEQINAGSGGSESNEAQHELILRPRDYTVKFSFPHIDHINPPILEVRDVNFRYGEKLPWLFRGVNFGLDMDSRVCIVGPNGSGKSTIIKLITGELNPPEGEVKRNPRLRLGVYNQHFVDRLPMDVDPVAYLQAKFDKKTDGTDYQSIRNLLGRYGLEGHAHTIPIRDLSGGQKARVVFAELSLQCPHLLFLDEPTNNLDIESIDALCDALKEYNGGVVLVSHDARLIETTNCQLWVVDEKNVQPWTEGFADYRQHLLEKLEAQMAAIMPGSGERPK
jgi:ATP-binding cassette subfamily F protein 1